MLVWFAVFALLALVILYAVLVTVLVPALGLPTWVVALSLATPALWGAQRIILWPLRRRMVKTLRGMTTPALEDLVFRDRADYFRALGADEPAVRRFRALVQARDLPALQAEWVGLRRQFLQLEQRAGHRGRPLLMEHFTGFEQDLQVLAERRRRA